MNEKITSLFFSRNVIIYFLGKLIPALSTLLMMVVGIKFLGKTDFGKYSLMWNTAMVISSLAIGWIQQSILRFNSSEDGKKEDHRFRFYNVSVISCGFVLLTASVIGLFYFKVSFLSSMAFGLFAFLYSMLVVHLTILQSRFKSARFAILESVFYLFSLVLIFFFLHFFIQMSYMAFFNAMTIVLSVIFFYMLLKDAFRGNHVKQIFSLPGKQFFNKIFLYGFPLTIWLFVSGLFNVGDRYIIQYYGRYESVGSYVAIYDLVYKVSAFLCMPLLLTYHPAIVQAWNQNDFIKSRFLIKRIIYIETGLILILLIGYALFSEIIFNHYFQLKEKQLFLIVAPLVISSMFWQLALFAQKPLEMLFKQKIMLISIVASLSLNVILNLILVPVYGYIAAAYTTLACTSLYLALVLFFSSAALKRKINA